MGDEKHVIAVTASCKKHTQSVCSSHVLEKQALSFQGFFFCFSMNMWTAEYRHVQVSDFILSLSF